MKNIHDFPNKLSVDYLMERFKQIREDYSLGEKISYAHAVAKIRSLLEEKRGQEIYEQWTRMTPPDLPPQSLKELNEASRIKLWDEIVEFLDSELKKTTEEIEKIKRDSV